MLLALQQIRPRVNLLHEDAFYTRTLAMKGGLALAAGTLRTHSLSLLVADEAGHVQSSFVNVVEPVNIG